MKKVTITKETAKKVGLAAGGIGLTALAWRLGVKYGVWHMGDAISKVTETVTLTDGTVVNVTDYFTALINSMK